MGKTDFVVILTVTAGAAGYSACNGVGKGDTQVAEQAIDAVEGPVWTSLAIRIVQDNDVCSDQLEAAWGFAAHLTGPEETILFDTGSDGSLLLGNMGKLGLAPNRIETVILSHDHADHTGGLVALLKQHTDVTLYGLKSFPDRLKQAVHGYGVRFVEVNGPQPVGRNVYSTGQMGTRIREQALIVRTKRGLVVVTGCAHPGVIRMIEKVRTLHEDDILLVLGGFHLAWDQTAEIEQIIRAFKRLGVRYVAPAHCSGDKARALFQEHFGAHCLSIGVGATIALGDLK